ncbi:hypothetical protein CC2G_013412 [Coprinopsis cinerea AmutBmut pab1-1]|nr:hypothetical protein CC2G_013412 [Coprinopsis cinerea AmutBmut pab1-1]
MLLWTTDDYPQKNLRAKHDVLLGELGGWGRDLAGAMGDFGVCSSASSWGAVAVEAIVRGEGNGGCLGVGDLPSTSSSTMSSSWTSCSTPSTLIPLSLGRYHSRIHRLMATSVVLIYPRPTHLRLLTPFAVVVTIALVLAVGLSTFNSVVVADSTSSPSPGGC